MDQVSDVIARLKAIESAGSRNDGVVCFARLYREVTEGVSAGLGRATFANPSFLAALDVRFAELFFAALEAHARDPGRTPPAWRPLFAQRARHGIAPLQFALAGMNAHINRDLPVALVETSRDMGVDLRTAAREHADFVRVNGLLADVERRVKASYLSGWAAVVDRLVHRVNRIDDVVAMWDVGRARDAAWTNGQALWELRDEAELSTQFLAALDRMVGLASRGLLVPADTVVQRLGRLLR